MWTSRFVGCVLAILAGAEAIARGDDKSAAEDLFIKAKQLQKAGEIEEACDLFAKSQALDPQLGTEYNLALCEVDTGKLASAWTLFRELAQRDSNTARRADSAKRADALAARVAKLLITTSGPVVPGLKVTRAEVDITNLLGVEDPVDPGTYHIIASADGFEPWSTDVDVTSEGAVITVKIPELTRASSALGPATDERPPKEPTVREVAPTPAGSHRKLIAGGVGGAGVVALGVGIYLGSVASSDWSQVRDLCPDLSCRDPDSYQRAQTLIADTRSAGNLSTALVVVGVAAAAGGAVLWLTAPRHSEHGDLALRVAPTVGGLVIAGGF